MEEFDGYHVWLGIPPDQQPPDQQPPDHYRLLGLTRFDSNRDAIANATDRQMAHVRTFQVGRHGDFSQRLLNELAAAKICLLTPEKKAAYDASLAASSPSPPPPGAPLPPNVPAPPVPVPPVGAPQQDRSEPLPRTTLPRLLQWDWLAVYLLFLAVALVTAWAKARHESSFDILQIARQRSTAGAVAKPQEQPRPPKSAPHKPSPSAKSPPQAARRNERESEAPTPAKPQEEIFPQRRADAEDERRLLGDWRIQVGKGHGTWTFHADGTVNSRTGKRPGKWKMGKTDILITWPHGGWAKLHRPLNLRGTSGDNPLGKGTILATKVK